MYYLHKILHIINFIKCSVISTLFIMLMALCCLPQEHIQPSFQRLKEGIDPEQSPMLMDLTKYIEKTWITSSVWPVHSWSVNTNTIQCNSLLSWYPYTNRPHRRRRRPMEILPSTYCSHWLNRSRNRRSQPPAYPNSASF
jgi:hypothetical protein